MIVTVTRINTPAMSSIGYGEGRDEAGNEVSFVGDHRPMRDIGEAIAQARDEDDLPTVDLEDWQISAVPPFPFEIASISDGTTITTFPETS